MAKRPERLAFVLRESETASLVALCYPFAAKTRHIDKRGLGDPVGRRRQTAVGETNANATVHTVYHPSRDKRSPRRHGDGRRHTFQLVLVSPLGKVAGTSSVCSICCLRCLDLIFQVALLQNHVEASESEASSSCPASLFLLQGGDLRLRWLRKTEFSGTTTPVCEPPALFRLQSARSHLERVRFQRDDHQQSV